MMPKCHGTLLHNVKSLKYKILTNIFVYALQFPQISYFFSDFLKFINTWIFNLCYCQICYEATAANAKKKPDIPWSSCQTSVLQQIFDELVKLRE